MDEPVRTPWHPWEAIPVGFAALCATVLVAFAFQAAGVSADCGATAQVTSLAFQGSLVGFSVAWVAVRHRRGIGALGLRARRGARELAMGAWVGAGLFAGAVFLLLPLVRTVWRVVSGEPPGGIEQPILCGTSTLFEVVLGAFVVVVAAPLGEEIFFRGFLFGSLRGRLRFLPAGLISGAAFAILHVDPQVVVVMVFVGLALAWLYERRGTLVAPMAAHAMFNVIGYTLLLMYRT